MISLESFRIQLRNLFEEKFTDAEFVVDERRSTILEIRIFLTPEIFMEVYVNGITGKKNRNFFNPCESVQSVSKK